MSEQLTHKQRAQVKKQLLAAAALRASSLRTCRALWKYSAVVGMDTPYGAGCSALAGALDLLCGAIDCKGLDQDTPWENAREAFLRACEAMKL